MANTWLKQTTKGKLRWISSHEEWKSELKLMLRSKQGKFISEHKQPWPRLSVAVCCIAGIKVGEQTSAVTFPLCKISLSNTENNKNLYFHHSSAGGGGSSSFVSSSFSSFFSAISAFSSVTSAFSFFSSFFSAFSFSTVKEGFSSATNPRLVSPPDFPPW